MRITLLGSGNVATHLGKALKDNGHTIVQVWSRNPEHAKILADNLGASFTDTIAQLTEQADIYILAVSDNAISKLASAFPFRDKILVHTSGTSDLTGSAISGVFYPVQTFSKQKSVNFSAIPIAVEGEDSKITDLLLDLARSVSAKVVKLSSEQRKTLHIAAVFACNFSNHLYAIADEILKSNGLEFDLIRPLITETAEKIQLNSPADVQTGPAIRNDKTTLNKHLQFLENNASFKELYERLSQSIINFDQKK